MDKGATILNLAPGASEVQESVAGAVMISIAYALLAYFSLQLTAGYDSVAAFWMGNAFVVGMLLGRGKRCRVASVGLCFVVNFAIEVWVEVEPTLAALIAASNMLEILLALYALDRFVIRSLTFDNLGQFVKLATIGAIVPFVSGSLAATAVGISSGSAWLAIYFQWLAAHCLQIPIFSSVT